jgi:hypothetical protein
MSDPSVATGDDDCTGAWRTYEAGAPVYEMNVGIEASRVAAVDVQREGQVEAWPTRWASERRAGERS